MVPRLLAALFFLTALLSGIRASSSVDDIPDVDADVFTLPESEISFYVEGEMKFDGIKFADNSAYQYALYCGFDASDRACTSCTDKPKWCVNGLKLPCHWRLTGADPHFAGHSAALRFRLSRMFSVPWSSGASLPLLMDLHGLAPGSLRSLLVAATQKVES
jgi:hypothetical protein